VSKRIYLETRLKKGGEKGVGEGGAKETYSVKATKTEVEQEFLRLPRGQNKKTAPGEQCTSLQKGAGRCIYFQIQTLVGVGTPQLGVEWVKTETSVSKRGMKNSDDNKGVDHLWKKGK